MQTTTTQELPSIDHGDLATVTGGILSLTFNFNQPTINIGKNNGNGGNGGDNQPPPRTSGSGVPLIRGSAI